MAGGERALRLGTRGSPLALAQAHEARRRLTAARGWAEHRVEVVVIRTTGDAIQDRALSEAGGKGLFTKELDLALIAGDIDVAVHSAKDLPTHLPEEVALSGFLPREDVRDALIARGDGTMAALPRGAAVGSASLRRQAQLRRLRPDLDVRLLRGNVQTRLRRVDDGDFQATILALAGLKRLGLAGRVTEMLALDAFLPAVGQGAIAIAARRGDEAVERLLAPILDAETGAALACERAFLAVLDGSCRTPIAGHARVEGARVHFRGEVLAADGSESVAAEAEGDVPEAVGRAAAQDLLDRAPGRLIAALGG